MAHFLFRRCAGTRDKCRRGFGESAIFYKLRGFSMSGIAIRVVDERRAEELSDVDADASCRVSDIVNIVTERLTQKEALLRHTADPAISAVVDPDWQIVSTRAPGGWPEQDVAVRAAQLWRRWREVILRTILKG